MAAAVGAVDDDQVSLSTDAHTRAKVQSILDLPLSDDHTKDLTCDLCGKGCWSASPFPDAHPGDCFGGFRAWHRYRKSPCGAYKSPRDKLCKICQCVFVTSAHKIQYKSVKDYLKFLDGKPEDHSSFKKGVAKLIAKVCDDDRPSMEVLKDYSKEVPTETVKEDFSFA